MGRGIKKGVNDLWTLRPDIAERLVNPEDGYQYGKGSSTKELEFWCPVGHSYRQIPVSACKGFGCNVCSGHNPLYGFNSLWDTHPEVASRMVDPELGKTIGKSYNKGKIEFRCDKGENHTYWKKVWDACEGSCCNICSGYVILPGFNDLWTTNPGVASRLVDPKLGKEIGEGYREKVEFHCDKGEDHTYWQAPKNACKQVGCGFCSGQITLRGFNTLWDTNPEIASRLVDPEVGWGVTKGSGRKVEFWCEEFGHSYEQTVEGAVRGYMCARHAYLSTEWEKYFKRILPPNTDGQYRLGISPYKRYDFYVPEYNLIIELDGPYHHQDKYETDTKFTLDALVHGYRFVRVRGYSNRYKLEYLPINNPNLLQLKVDTDNQPESYDKAWSVIEDWVKGFNYGNNNAGC